MTDIFWTTLRDSLTGRVVWRHWHYSLPAAEGYRQRKREQGWLAEPGITY